MSDPIPFLDDATRPVAPELAGLTDAQRMPGQHLAMIHEHFRGHMAQLRQLIDLAEADGGATNLKAEAEALPILENYRRFGALCGQHCSIIHGHHSIEDYAIFPELGAKDAAFKKVVDRLKAEHEIVHELLLRLIEALGALDADPRPETFAAARVLFDDLERVLLSHFSYEEASIGDAIGYYGIGL